MHPTSDSAHLTAQQVLALDDAMFSSNPGAYWRSRIDQLLREAADPDYTTGLGAEVTALGIDPAMLTATTPSQDNREMQRALDAFALRHHVAEALVRLLAAVVAARSAPGTSVWAQLADSPRSLHDVVLSLRALEDSKVPAGDLLLALDDQQAVNALDEVPDDLMDGLQCSWQWVQRAMEILDGDGLDANAGHNKLKHGFAVRARGDLRVSIVRTPPEAIGTMPLSAFDEAVNIVDSRSLEFLERLPRRFGPAAGSWELTVLNLNPGRLLAEALMMATVYAGAFAAAASRHFAGRDRSFFAHPGLALGPHPERIRHRATGYRQALTQPTAGGRPRSFTVEVAGRVVGLTMTGEHKRVTVREG